LSTQKFPGASGHHGFFCACSATVRSDLIPPESVEDPPEPRLKKLVSLAQPDTLAAKATRAMPR